MRFGASAFRGCAIVTTVLLAAVVLPPTVRAEAPPPGAITVPKPPVGGVAAPATEAETLRAELAAAQAQFDQAQRQQAAATNQIAALKVQLDADRVAADAAQAQIQRYARWAYIAARDADAANLLARLAAGDQSSLAQAQSLLSAAANAQAKRLSDAIGVLARNQGLREQQLRLQADATAAMTRAQTHGQEVVANLTALASTLGPEPAQSSTTAQTCPHVAPAGSLSGGAEQIGVHRLCQRSVKQARSPSAARAIIWAFNHLGSRYIDGAVPIDVEHYDGFNCANYIARAYYWGSRISGFMTLPWTPAYATPPPFLRPIGAERRAGDINLMWRSGLGISGSAGRAGHAQMFIADGWVIQSGGTAGLTNVAPYPNQWSGWEEVHFAVDTAFSPSAGPPPAGTATSSPR